MISPKVRLTISRRRRSTSSIAGWVLLVLMAIAVLSVVANLAEGGFVAVAVSLLLVALVTHFGLGLRRDMQRVAILPYFEAPVPEADTFGHGGAIPRCSQELDDAAVRLVVQPLSAYGFGDDLHHEELVWHAPSEGLATFHALRDEATHSQATWANDELIDDLSRIHDALEAAVARGSRFCLLVRVGGGTCGQEHEVRKGHLLGDCPRMLGRDHCSPRD